MKLIRIIWLAVFAIGLPLPCVCPAETTVTNLWQLEFGVTDYDAKSSPAVAPDGTIYQATFTGKLLAVTPDGKLKWTFQAGREIQSSPAIADDGTIYFGSRDRQVYAVTPEGSLKWTFATGAWVDSSPAIGADGTVYFGSWDTNFYALNPDGSKKWSFPTRGIVDSSPAYGEETELSSQVAAIGGDGTIYFGSHDKKLYALNPDGTLHWAFMTGGRIIASPAIAFDGSIYFTSLDGYLYALAAGGKERWRLLLGGITQSSPALDSAGNIYLSVNNHDVSVSPDGKVRWDWTTAQPIEESPAVTAADTVYFSWPWRRLYAIRTNQEIVWYSDLNWNLSASPVIGDRGAIYFPAGKCLYAINPASSLPPPAKSSWPMFRANARHSGRVQKPD